MTANDHPRTDGEMFVVDTPYEVANWRPLVNWLLYVPHAIIVGALRTAANAIFIVYWFTLLATGRLHKGMYRFLVMYERYDTRASSFLVGYSENYPPFDFEPGCADDNAYPGIRLDLPEPPESTPRTAALNWLLAIPHYIVVVLIGIAVVAVAIIGWFAVLFNGAWPKGMRDFMVRFYNYYFRVWVYVAMVDTKYPRFGL